MESPNNIKKISHFFDKLEDKTRTKLSHYPIVYAFFGGIGVVLFWRGIWHTADIIPIIQSGPVSILVGSIILLMTGVFVSAFIGNTLILTGLKGEKKLSERTEEGLETEDSKIKRIQTTVNKIEDELVEIEKKLDKKQQ